MTSSNSRDIDSSLRPATLSAAARECLGCIAGHMIPADPRRGMPGADDAAIFADMAGSVMRDAERLTRLLGWVDAAAGGRLCGLPREERELLLARLRAEAPAGFAVVEAVIARAYYRDDRVLRSIGMEPRPPFPDGYALPATDWSLLEPVRARGSIVRSAE
jgi:hypothetical protein